MDKLPQYLRRNTLSVHGGYIRILSGACRFMQLKKHDRVVVLQRTGELFIRKAREHEDSQLCDIYMSNIVRNELRYSLHFRIPRHMKIKKSKYYGRQLKRIIDGDEYYHYETRPD